MDDYLKAFPRREGAVDRANPGSKNDPNCPLLRNPSSDLCVPLYWCTGVEFCMDSHKLNTYTEPVYSSTQGDP